MPRIIFDTSKLKSCKTQTSKLTVAGMGDNGYWKIELKPGGNTVTAQQLELLKNDETFRGMLPAFEFEGKAALQKLITVAEEADKIPSSPLIPKPPSENTVKSEEIENLKGYSISEADPIIEATNDLEKLAQWREADERKGIKDAIDRRMATINAESVQQ